MLPDSKTDEKLIRLNAPALEILSGLGRGEDDDWVLPSRSTGRPYKSLYFQWDQIRVLAGLDGLRIHDLRHLFASTGVMGGLPLAMVGKLLGHQRASTTERYSHIADDPAAAAAESIGKTLKAQLSGAKGDLVWINHN